MEPKLTELGPQIHGELVTAIDFCRPRRNFPCRKCLHRGPQLSDVLTKVKLQSGQVRHPRLLRVSLSVLASVL
jgi:hypothetical protein